MVLNNRAISMTRQVLSCPLTDPIISHAAKVGDFAGSAEATPARGRKPYTVTKQRERWSEEDHQKFLEALKVHGRAWQQIKEHIGTKSAVQIRSHAQKFFLKLTRGVSCSMEGGLKDIRIPPPRPKRRPVFPYPRKASSSLSPPPVEKDGKSTPSAIFSAFTSSKKLTDLSKLSQEELKEVLVDPVSEEFESFMMEESTSFPRSVVSIEYGSVKPMNSEEFKKTDAAAASFRLFGKLVGPVPVKSLNQL